MAQYTELRIEIARKYADQDISLFGPVTADVSADIAVDVLDKKEKEGLL